MIYTFRIFHVAVGSIGFLAAPIALLTPKGGVTHRRAGLAFAYAMSAASVSAIVLAIMGNNLFFTLVGVFSLLLIWNGWRVLTLLRVKRGMGRWFDWAIQSLALLLAVTLLGYASWLAEHGRTDLGIVLALFGVIVLVLALQQIRRLIHPPTIPFTRLSAHASGMTAAYIASLSAFSANVLTPRVLPFWVSMIWPTILITPVLSIQMRRLRGGRMEVREKPTLIGED